jgi:hypothetical protein
VTRRARRAPKWLWLIPICLATSLFVTGFIRFRAPIDPFLVMLAALAIPEGWPSGPAGRRPLGSADDERAGRGPAA